MDELPELLVDAIDGSTVIETVDIGGGDTIAVTPAETHLYRSEGLLSEESVETFSHDVDRFAVGTGRRKRTIRLETIEGERSLTVPAKVTEQVLEAMLEGILRGEGLLDPSETVEAQFRFSDLTLVVTDEQLLKHVGGAVWSGDYETFRFEDLTGLDFEAGSVATQIVVETNGRPQRVKVPNDHAGRVRNVIQRAAFEYHGVSSLDGLNAEVGLPEANDEGADKAERESTDTDPKTTPTPDSDLEADSDTEEPMPTESGDSRPDTGWSPPADQDVTGPRGRVQRSTRDEKPATGTVAETDAGAAESDETDTEPKTNEDAKAETKPDHETRGGDGTPEISTLSGRVDALSERVDQQTELIETLSGRVDALSERVDQQTELIESQQETLEQLVDELRRGR